MAQGLIFDVRRYSIHDGPGIRTTVFFKGCLLHCAWCHNPESQSFGAELMLLPNRCIACGACGVICPYGAVTEIEGEWVTDRQKCQVCGQCSQVCYADARQVVGEAKTVEEIMAMIDLDQAFYLQSEGGVTFSGGEPLAQPELLAELLSACKARGYHTTLDTCGHAPWETLARLLPDINLVMYDLKLMDPVLHQHYTGVTNEVILRNLTNLARSGKPYWVRVPVIPSITDTPKNLSAMAEFLGKLPMPVEIHLLPYHNVAETKYTNLGKTYKLGSVAVPTEIDLSNLDYYFDKADFKIQHGG